MLMNPQLMSSFLSMSQFSCCTCLFPLISSFAGDCETMNYENVAISLRMALFMYVVEL